MKICVKEARRLKLKTEFRRLADEEDEETVLNFLAQYEIYGYLKKYVVDLVEEFARLEKALKWKIYYFIGFSEQASTLGVFLIQTIRFRSGIHQPFKDSSI